MSRCINKNFSSVSHEQRQRTKKRNVFFSPRIFTATVHHHMVIPLFWHHVTIKCPPSPSLFLSRSPTHVEQLVFLKVGQPPLSNIRLLGVVINPVVRLRGQARSAGRSSRVPPACTDARAHTQTTASPCRLWLWIYESQACMQLFE